MFMIKQLVLLSVLLVQSKVISKESYYEIASLPVLTVDSISQVLGISPTKIEGNWTYWCDRDNCIKGYFIGGSGTAKMIKWESR